MIGVPGAGKDLQSDKLYTETQGFFDAALSMSGLIESALEAETIVGYTSADKDAGVLLTDELCGAVLEDGLSALPSDVRVVVSGFPRTSQQAHFALSYCLKRDWTASFVLLRVSEEVAMKRVGRRKEEDLEKKGRSRPDDEEDVARLRFRKQLALLDEVEPIVRLGAAWVYDVDGTPEPKAVFTSITNLLRVSEGSLVTT